MANELIIFDDPMQKRVSAVISLNTSKIKSDLKADLNGRSVCHMEKSNISSKFFAEKINNSSV